MASGKVRVAGLLLGAVVVVVGCQRSLFNGFLDPSQVGRFPMQSVPQNIQGVVSIMDEPLDISAAGATDDGGSGGQLQGLRAGAGRPPVRVTIFELLAEGTESTFDRQLSESGYVSIPVLGSVKLEGMNSREAEVHIADLLSPAILRNPRVSVVIIDRRNQTFEMLGGFVATGSYVIPRPNFRLMDALAVARDVQPGIETIYVLRSYDYMQGSSAQSQPAMNQPALPDTEAPPAGDGAARPASQAVPSEAELQGVMPGAGRWPGVGRAPQADLHRRAVGGGARRGQRSGREWSVERGGRRDCRLGAVGTTPAVTTAAVDWEAAITEAAASGSCGSRCGS